MPSTFALWRPSRRGPRSHPRRRQPPRRLVAAVVLLSPSSLKFREFSCARNGPLRAGGEFHLRGGLRLQDGPIQVRQLQRLQVFVLCHGARSAIVASRKAS